MQTARSKMRRYMREHPNDLGKIRRRRGAVSQGHDLLGLNGGTAAEAAAAAAAAARRKKKKKNKTRRSRAQGYAKDPLYRATILRRRRLLEESGNITPTTQRTLDYFNAVLERQEAVKRVNKERRYTDELCILRTTHPEAPELHVCNVMMTCRGADMFRIAKIAEQCGRLPLRHSMKQPRMGYMRVMDSSINVTGTGRMVLFCRNVYAAHKAVRYASLALNQNGVPCAPRDIRIKHIMATMNVGFMLDIMAMARMHRGKVKFNSYGRTSIYTPDVPVNADKPPFSARFYLRGSIVIVGAKTYTALCQAQKILWTLAQKFKMDDETKEVIRQEGETMYYKEKLTRTPISFQELMQAATHRQRELTGSHTVSITHTQSNPSPLPPPSPSPSSPSHHPNTATKKKEEEKNIFDSSSSSSRSDDDDSSDSDEGLEKALQQGAAHMIEKTESTLARLNRLPKKRRAASSKAVVPSVKSVITVSNTPQQLAPVAGPLALRSSSVAEDQVKRLKLITSATLPVHQKTTMHDHAEVVTGGAGGGPTSSSSLVLRPGEVSTRQVRPTGLNRSAREAASSALTPQDLIVASKVGAGFGGLPTFSVQRTTKVTHTNTNTSSSRTRAPTIENQTKGSSTVTEESLSTYWTRPSIPSATIPYSSNGFVCDLSTALNTFTSAVLPTVMAPNGVPSARRDTESIHVRNALPP